MAQSFRPTEHVRRRADFESAYNSGAKVSGRLMTIFVKSNTTGQARLGVAATRKIGGAVGRNRAKRLARELFRRSKPIAPVDVIVIPRREFLDAPYPHLEREFAALLERAQQARSHRHGSAANRPRRPRGARADSRV
jgi:ribonuclease P protein component